MPLLDIIFWIWLGGVLPLLIIGSSKRQAGLAGGEHAAILLAISVMWPVTVWFIGGKNTPPKNSGR